MHCRLVSSLFGGPALRTHPALECMGEMYRGISILILIYVNVFMRIVSLGLGLRLGLGFGLGLGLGTGLGLRLGLGHRIGDRLWVRVRAMVVAQGKSSVYPRSCSCCS